MRLAVRRVIVLCLSTGIVVVRDVRYGPGSASASVLWECDMLMDVLGPVGRLVVYNTTLSLHPINIMS